MASKPAIAGAIRARGLADVRLIDEDVVSDEVLASQRPVGARGVGRFTLALAQCGIEHVLHQCRLPEPDTPVTTISSVSRVSSERFLRLFWRVAPRYCVAFRFRHT